MGNTNEPHPGDVEHRRQSCLMSLAIFGGFGLFGIITIIIGLGMLGNELSRLFQEIEATRVESAEE